MVSLVKKVFRITKEQLLYKLHELVWRDDDLMDQDTLFELQDLIDQQIVCEINAGTMRGEVDKNFIHDVGVVF